VSRFLVVLLLLVVAVVGLGFYLGWFHLSTDNTAQNPNFTISVDKDKFQQDKEKATEKVQEAGQTVKEKIGAGAEKVKKETSKP